MLNINDEIINLKKNGLLNDILIDHTTGNNIIWATDEYSDIGVEFGREQQITESLITGINQGLIKNRAEKESSEQIKRSKKYAEVFTPLRICEKMNDFLDGVWFSGDEMSDLSIDYPKPTFDFNEFNWKRYVASNRMEITCGEAPFLVSRYDASNGKFLEVENRIGLLDRKIQIINKNVNNFEEWLEWVYKAFESTYGYEFQGDNLLIARINFVCTFEDYLEYRWNKKPTKSEYKKIIDIVTWNLWQMDGLNNHIPYSGVNNEFEQLLLFGDSNENLESKSKNSLCRIYNWKSKFEIRFSDLYERGHKKMRFDFIIGNPPYQEDTSRTSDNPIYHKFMDAAYKISDKVELITPARFLFNAGKTPKYWNQRMLNDKHFKILYFESDSRKVFSEGNFAGGVVISYHDMTQTFNPIINYSQYDELNSILHKVYSPLHFDSVMDYIVLSLRFDLDNLYADYGEYKSVIGSHGTERRLTTNIFDLLPELFCNERQNKQQIGVYGLLNDDRTLRWIDKKYIRENKKSNLNFYKVCVPKSYGGGLVDDDSAIIIGPSFVAEPGYGHTQTFISIGCFETHGEADALLKYIKTRFARTMLSILKVTQDNNVETWKYVPWQDFTSNSDINWTQSIENIDGQLFKKYGISDEQELIDFIYTHIRSME